MELIHSNSNPIFDIGVVFSANYSFSGRRRPIDSETLLVTDFVNLKIKPAQSFRDAHKDRVCVRVFIWVSAHTCISIYVYTVFFKKKSVVPKKEMGRKNK
jgi:hypothetical protein